MVSGDIICVVAETLSESTFRPSGFSLSPKNLQSWDMNRIFFELSVRLLSLAVSKNAITLPFCSVIVETMCENVICNTNDSW